MLHFDKMVGKLTVHPHSGPNENSGARYEFLDFQISRY